MRGRVWLVASKRRLCGGEDPFFTPDVRVDEPRNKGVVFGVASTRVSVIGWSPNGSLYREDIASTGWRLVFTQSAFLLVGENTPIA